MPIKKLSLFIRWVYAEKLHYPELIKHLENGTIPRSERNIILLKSIIEKLGNEKLIQDCNDAWNEFRCKPKLVVKSPFRKSGRLN